MPMGGPLYRVYTMEMNNCSKCVRTAWPLCRSIWDDLSRAFLLSTGPGLREYRTLLTLYDRVRIHVDICVTNWFDAKILRKNEFPGKTNIITIDTHMVPNF